MKIENLKIKAIELMSDKSKLAPPDGGSSYLEDFEFSNVADAIVSHVVGSLNSEVNLETLGGLVDRLENLLGALTLPLEPQMHLDGLTPNLKQIKNELKQAYFEFGGEDVWVE